MGAIAEAGSADAAQGDHALAALAASDVTVLIGGETGSGKGVFARGLHARSRRCRGAFVVADCSAMPGSLFESQMFGHVKGAFTGASSDRPGLVRTAHGGTLFLDEVGELPLELQAKLLTLIEDQTVQPVGGDKRVEVDIRIIAATHRDLRAMVEAGTFREDLFYRLAVVEMDVPPLRSRLDELGGLVEELIERKASLLGVEARPASAALMETLRAYDWPGNIRELGNCIERALVLSRGPELEAAALPPRVLNRLQARMTRPSTTPSPADIGRTLDSVGGNKAEAARQLGISRRHLYRLMATAS